MQRQVTTTLLLLVFLGIAVAPSVQALPEHVSYQGKLLLNGQAFTGPAEFKFAVVDGPGTVTFWSHDGSSTVGDPPATSMTLFVEQGIFSVRLGEIASGQVPLAPDFLMGAGDAALRVWVDTGSGFEQLSDQPISSAAFAQHSEAANRSLGNFFVAVNLGIGVEAPVERLQVDWGNALIKGPFNFTGPTEDAALFLGDQSHYIRSVWGEGVALGTFGAPDAVFVEQGTGNVGIGTANPGAKLHVDGMVEMAGLKLSNAPSPGYVLTSDASGIGSWQPAGAGQADTDWTISGSDMHSGVAGNVGIGTATPAEKLHVAGRGLFALASDRSVAVSTPGGWPGLIAITPNTHRRDIIFDDNGMRLLADDSSAPPAAENGLTIRESGYVGINTLNPDEYLHVNGDTRATSFLVKNSGWTDVYISGDATDGGILELHGPDGPSDWGITMKGGAVSGGAIMDLYNSSNAATVELNGSTGSLILGNGSNATVYFDGNTGGGGQYRASNNTGTITYQVLGQAYGSGSQTNMYDSAGLIAQQWTAANREWKVTDASGTLQIVTRGDVSGGEMTLYQADGQAGVVLDGDNGGDGEIRVYDQAGSVSVRIVGHDSGGNGRVITDVLEITGGADLSENFDINGSEAVEPGMVVCIDPGDTGKLVQSRRPYERTVAGIVSGAGGVRPGMLMGQQGSAADGEHPVALTGRVWTWCDASQSSIEPGDLLTTSNTAGHAMKVTDHSQANGAILGKAMSKLESGRGLVLVLVSLQ